MKSIKYFALVLLSGFFAYSCSHKKEKAAQNDSSQNKAYKTIVLTQSSLAEDIKLPGVLQPFEFVQIYPKLTGFIKNITVDRGSIVKTGQLLIQLEAPEVEQKTAAARLKYLEGRSDVQLSKDRYSRLLQTSKTPGTVSAFDLQAASSKMMADSATMQAELADYQAQKTLESYLTVTAPFNGIITERNVHPGALVGPGSADNSKPMLVLQQQNLLRLVVNVPEQYSAQIHDGETVHYTINALPGKTFEGKVSRSSGSLSEHYRAETIEIDVSNPNDEIKAGMYAEINIPVSGNGQAFTVPKTAIVTTTERKYVIAVRDNVTKYIDVSIGNESDSDAEVFGDLKPGDKIIANASYDIAEGVNPGNQGQ